MPKHKPKQIAEVSEGGPEEAGELLHAIEEAERYRLELWRLVESNRAALKQARELYEEADAAAHKMCQRRMEVNPLFAEEVEVEVEAE